MNFYYADSDGDGMLDNDGNGNPVPCGGFCDGMPIPVSENPITGFYYPCIPILTDTPIEESDENNFIAGMPLPGCTDPSAYNWNILYNDDNGNCNYIGCTNSEAINYFCNLFPTKPPI